MTDDRVLREILTKYRRVAVVGMSKNPEKEAHTVPKYLIDRGYDVVPVNPTATEILGRRAYPDLTSVPGGYGIVDVFRPSADVSAVVDEAIRDGRGKVIWTQLGIWNDEAAKKAERAGFVVIQARCIRTEHQRLFVP
ncbi:MAG: CoA-binding protein [Methanobacteriota archaeon]|nr:MAG: CoA-binding protein [Euryarchaeota archaeon]